MAAATLRRDRWGAGARLMQSANLQGWARLAAAEKLWQDNETALADCGQAVARTRKPQRCVVTVAAGTAESDR